ncbi:ImmA/IrrE family metallo-endopeptidase [Nonomuraea sp. NPDC050536]|uniref:ImmA/IrrE family metallo-endopeptidase n=1 Tax=Nonomuraea sp. NPDC050536 TaxID=3364366 RepID=UPI0037C61E61
MFRQTLEGRGFLALHLSLTNDGCRGFSLYDELAPVVAVNTAYIPQARLFSYGHELGHITLHSDGICTNKTTPGVERWCEEFAAALFMPRQDIENFVENVLHDSGMRGRRAVDKISSRFKVSLRAAAIRYIQLGYAASQLYKDINALAEYRKPPKSKGGGGETTPEKRLREWGSLYPALLLEAEEQQRLSRNDVLEYLNMSNVQLLSMKEMLGVGPASVE